MLDQLVRLIVHTNLQLQGQLFISAESTLWTSAELLPIDTAEPTALPRVIKYIRTRAEFWHDVEI